MYSPLLHNHVMGQTAKMSFTELANNLIIKLESTEKKLKIEEN